MRFSKILNVAALSLALAVGAPVLDSPDAFAGKAKKSSKASAKAGAKAKKQQIRCKVLKHIYSKTLARIEGGGANHGRCNVFNKTGNRILAMGDACALPTLASEDASEACAGKGVTLNAALVDVVVPPPPPPPPPSATCPCWDINAIAALAADPNAGCADVSSLIDGDPLTTDVWCTGTGTGPALSASPSSCYNDTDLTQTNVITYDFTGDPVNGSALADQCTADLLGLGLPVL